MPGEKCRLVIACEGDRAGPILPIWTKPYFVVLGSKPEPAKSMRIKMLNMKRFPTLCYNEIKDGKSPVLMML